jgi:hypothetical protein
MNGQNSRQEIDHLLDTASVPAVPEQRLRQIEAVMVADLRPVRPLASAGIYFVAFAGIFAAIWVASWLAIPVRGWEALSDLQRTWVFAPMIAIVALLAFSLVRQMTPAAGYSRGAAMLAGSLFLWLLVFMLLVFRPMPEAGFVHDAEGCFRMGMLFSIPAAIMVAWVLSRGAALHRGLAGATAGGLAGLTGLAVLEIHCPILNLYHILMGHVSVAVVCALLGYIFSGVTFSRWRSNP